MLALDGRHRLTSHANDHRILKVVLVDALVPRLHPSTLLLGAPLPVVLFNTVAGDASSLLFHRRDLFEFTFLLASAEIAIDALVQMLLLLIDLTNGNLERLVLLHID